MAKAGPTLTSQMGNDELMWRALTGQQGPITGKQTVPVQPQGSQQGNVMTGPQLMELARGGLRSAKTGQWLGVR